MRPISFSPKSFLKARRPERFSDTVVAEATELDRSLLEFHLSSLTSRSQETDFERFARRLCECEICPNLYLLNKPGEAMRLQTFDPKPISV